MKKSALFDTSKTFRLAAIYFASVFGLYLCRITAAYLPFSDNAVSWLFSFVYQAVFLGVLPFVLYRYTIERSPRAFARDFSFHPKVNPILYLIAFPVGILTFYLNVGVSALSYSFLSALGYVYAASPGTIYSSPEVLVLELLASCLFPAFFEELTNRGLLSGLFRDEQNDTVVILLMAVTFGFWHQNVPQLLPTMVGGFIMAFLCVKSGSVFPGMIVHFLNNFIITMADYSEQHGGGFYTLYSNVIGGLSSNILILVISWILAGTMLSFLLHLFERLGEPERKRNYPNLARFCEESNSAPMFGIFRLGEENHLPLEKAAKPERAGYALFVVSCAVMVLTTLFTLIWGVMR